MINDWRRGALRVNPRKMRLLDPILIQRSQRSAAMQPTKVDR